MNLEELAQILTMERDSDRLQTLDDSFYEDSASYIHGLEDARIDASNYKEASMIDDETKNARILIEGVFDRRMSKLIEYASIAATGTRISVEGLTKSELPVYEAVVAALEKGRNEILVPILEIRHLNPAKNILGETTSKEKPIENPSASKEDEVMLVKVLKDIPKFVGVDGRHYHLSGEDVVVLPKANALVLCNKNVAVPLTAKKGD